MWLYSWFYLLGLATLRTIIQQKKERRILSAQRLARQRESKRANRKRGKYGKCGCRETQKERKGDR